MDQSLGKKKDLIFFLSFALILCSLYSIVYFSNYGNWFIHPHQFEVHLPKLLADSYHFQPSALLNIFKQFDVQESRPRFLGYLLIQLNLYTRIYAYNWLVLFPPFSWDWLLTITVGPILLYRLMIYATKDVVSSLTTVLLYTTSIGFLCEFGMPLIPSKPLSNLAIIVILFLVQRLNADKRTNDLIATNEIRYSTLIGISVTLLIGLFLDEVVIFGFIVILICCREFFYRAINSVDRNYKNTIAIITSMAIPLLIFIVFTIWVIPEIAYKLYGYRFDFLSSVLVNDEARASGKSFFAGKTYGFGWDSLLANFDSLIGLSLLPINLVGSYQHPSGSGVITGIKPNIIISLIIATTLIIAYRSSSVGKNQNSKFTRDAIYCGIFFVLFISILSGRHVPYISGYIYGSPIGIITSIVVGGWMSHIKNERSKLCACFFVIYMALIQLYNFNIINQSWIKFHNQTWISRDHGDALSLSRDRYKTNRVELNEIWNAWRLNDLNQYLDSHHISSAAAFIVYELRQFDLMKKRSTDQNEN